MTPSPPRGPVSLLASLLTIACATPHTGVPPATWESIGSLGIAASGNPTRAKVWTLDAAEGAEQGTLLAIQTANALTMGLWVIAYYGAGAVCVPAVGATLGAAYGVVAGPDDDEIRPVHDALLAAVNASCMVEVLEEGLTEEMDARLATTDVRAMHLVVPPGDYASAFEATDVDALLVFRIKSVEASGPWGDNPDGPLLLSGSVELLRRNESAPVFRHETRVALSEVDPIGPWWDDDAGEATERLGLGLELLAQRLAAELARGLSPAPGRDPAEGPVAFSPTLEGVWLPDDVERVLLQILTDARIASGEVASATIEDQRCDLELRVDEPRDPAALANALSSHPSVVRWTQRAAPADAEDPAASLYQIEVRTTQRP